MKSPFAIFRKYQKVLTVVLTGLAMFAFVVLGSISDTMAKGISDSAKIFLAVLVGGGVCWILGLKTKKSQEYSIWGAIVTGLAAVFIVISNAPAPAVQTTFGSLSQDELRELVNQRQIANQFISRAFTETSENRFQQPPLFGFGMNSMKEDVTLGYLFRHEAEQNGIVVTEESINNFINDFTQDKLTNSKFKEIRQELRISETRLYDVLQNELKSRMALSLLRPRTSYSPEEYWELFRKVNESQQLEIAPIPIEDFAKQVPEPNEEELTSFFKTYNKGYQRGPGIPGFREAPKWKIGYLEIDYEITEGEVAAITEDDIKKHYEENKELYRNIVVPEEKPVEGTSTVPPTGPELPVTKKPEDIPISPSLKEEKKEEKKPAPKQEKKPTPEKKPEPKKETPKPIEKPKVKKETKPAEKPAPAKKKEEKKTSSIGTDANSPVFATPGDSLLSFADEKKPAPKKETPKPVEKPKAKKEVKPAEKPVPAKKKEEQKKKETPPEKKKKEEKSEKAPPAPVKSPVKKTEEKPKEPTPGFQPLDNDLKEQIKDEILKERTAELLANKSKMALDAMRILQDKILDAEEAFAKEPAKNEKELSVEEKREQLKEKFKPVIEEINNDLKKYAETNNVKYTVTELLSAEELMDEEKNAFGRATDPVPSEFLRARAATLIQVISSAQILNPREGEIPSNNNRIVYWKLDDIDSRVPEFTEEGVKEKAIESYKNFKAIDLAKVRAEELQKIVTESKKTILESLGDQTVSTEKGSAKLALVESQSFSWLSFPTAPNLNPFQPPPAPVVNRVTGIENIDNTIMETIFNKLKVDEVGVVKDAGNTAYYVVQPKNRKPSTEGELEGVRTNFMNSNMFTFFSPFRSIFMADNQNANASLAQTLRKKYNLQVTQDNSGQKQ